MTKDNASLVQKLRESSELYNEAATTIEVLQNDLNTALGMLADWGVAVECGKMCDDCFKQVMSRDGPLRSMLDIEIAKARARRGLTRPLAWALLDDYGNVIEIEYYTEQPPWRALPGQRLVVLCDQSTINK